MFGINDKSLQLIKETLNTYPEIEEALIFGSRALGNYKKGSDVDIALKGSFKEDIILKVSTTLNQSLPLPYFFDILHYDTLSSKELKAHIDTFGISILKSIN
jgi:predicted nucleotidyltransferase